MLGALGHLQARVLLGFLLCGNNHGKGQRGLSELRGLHRYFSKAGEKFSVFLRQ